ncbi:glutamine synthetase [Mycobacterium dioxanotrophicus]|nr:glutamine synthetase [Mycobacterium dioxanotrophicus]
MASQLVAGLDGIDRGATPGEMSSDPHHDSTGQRLPISLEEAVSALEESSLFRDQLGDSLVTVLTMLKRNELKRFDQDTSNQAEHANGVSRWEHQEYFAAF